MEDAEGSEDSGEMSAMEEGEDGEWGGISGSKDTGSVDDSHSGTKPKKPPTGEELRTIKDASDLFKSSSFKLQVCTLVFTTLSVIDTSIRLTLFCLTYDQNHQEQRPLNNSSLLYTPSSRIYLPSLLNIH